MAVYMTRWLGHICCPISFSLTRGYGGAYSGCRQQSHYTLGEFVAKIQPSQPPSHPFHANGTACPVDSPSPPPPPPPPLPPFYPQIPKPRWFPVSADESQSDWIPKNPILDLLVRVRHKDKLALLMEAFIDCFNSSTGMRNSTSIPAVQYWHCRAGLQASVTDAETSAAVLCLRLFATSGCKNWLHSRQTRGTHT